MQGQPNVTSVAIALSACLAAPACVSGAEDSDDVDDAELVDNSGAITEDASGKADIAGKVCEWTDGGKVFKVTFKRFALEAAGRCYLYGGVGLIFGPQTGALGCAYGVGQAAIGALGKLAVNKVVKLACESGYVTGRVAEQPPHCDALPRGSRPQPCI